MSTPTREAHAPRWQQWLGHLKDTPATGLELGTWRGESAEVMLEDYYTHPDSRYYCVDHFQGSPEHHRLNVDCSGLERETRQRLEKFGHRAQIIKMDSAHAMKGFLADIRFDGIYVDASHDAVSVLRDTIIAWDLLTRRHRRAVRPAPPWNIDAHDVPTIVQSKSPQESAR